MNTTIFEKLITECSKFEEPEINRNLQEPSPCTSKGSTSLTHYLLKLRFNIILQTIRDHFME
jgi:hypothetical protein